MNDSQSIEKVDEIYKRLLDAATIQQEEEELYRTQREQAVSLSYSVQQHLSEVQGLLPREVISSSNIEKTKIESGIHSTDDGLATLEESVKRSEELRDNLKNRADFLARWRASYKDYCKQRKIQVMFVVGAVSVILVMVLVAIGSKSRNTVNNQVGSQSYVVDSGVKKSPVTTYTTTKPATSENITRSPAITPVQSSFNNEPVQQPITNDSAVSQTTATGNNVYESKIDSNKSLLQQAENYMKADRLTTPPGENAVDIYYKILASDPDHAEARNGLHQVALRLVALADVAIEKNETRKADTYLDKADETEKYLIEVQQARERLAAKKAEISKVADLKNKDKMSNRQQTAPVFDKTDQDMLSYVLENSRSGTENPWTSLDRGIHYIAVPQPAFKGVMASQNVDCRPVTLRLEMPTGKRSAASFSYCRLNGKWERYN